MFIILKFNMYFFLYIIYQNITFLRNGFWDIVERATSISKPVAVKVSCQPIAH